MTDAEDKSGRHGSSKGHGWDAAKLLTAVTFLFTVIFGAGKLVQKLETIEAARKYEAEQQAQRTRVHEDRYEKLRSAVDGIGVKVESLTEELKRVRWQRRRAAGVDSRP